ncbi:hypothetical protein ARSEF4850_000192 [Beauveria asiatica]
MSCHLPFAISDRGVASTNIEIAVGHVKHLLIENQEVSDLLFAGVPFGHLQPALLMRCKANLFSTLVAVDTAYAGHNGRVVVPSRCYYKPSKDRPLAGARCSVKDNVDIAGHKTTLCNRAWTDFYPTKTKNAACIQVLIEAGAIIVGKIKLQAVIMREEPLEC